MTTRDSYRFAQGIINEDMLESMRKRAGSRMRLDGYINNEVATASAIRRFTDGIGDWNPLWRDAEYASGTEYGRLVAPPSWVWSVCAGVQMGWRGLGGFHSGTEEEFFLPILLDDRITPEVIYRGFEGPSSSQFADIMIKDMYENRYLNQRGQLVARIIWWVLRYERKKAREKGKYSRIQLPHPWTDEELAGIQRAQLDEEVRGGNPRYWEDTEPGEKLKPLVEGPLGLTDMVAFVATGAVPIRFQAHGVALRDYQRHPAWAFRDPDTHAWEPIFAVHYNRKAANYQGLPYPYDLGIQRQCSLDHLVTGWAGDHAWLRKTRTEYRSFVYLSDVLWFNGEVTSKYTDADGEHCVDVSVTVTNQRGENVMPATATVVLPVRGEAASPVARRIER